MEKRYRILVTDDDAAICDLVATVLRAGNCDVEICHDGESALVAIRQCGPFDLLISDFMLPGISGLEFVTQIRESKEGEVLPILMASGHLNYAMEGRAKAAGANEFLHKPFTVSQLRVAVRRLLAPQAKAS